MISVETNGRFLFHFSRGAMLFIPAIRSTATPRTSREIRTGGSFGERKLKHPAGRGFQFKSRHCRSTDAVNPNDRSGFSREN
ncbi:MAG: hypothetical protein WEB58_03820 [Planctomycetaceae bacterium]